MSVDARCDLPEPGGPWTKRRGKSARRAAAAASRSTAWWAERFSGSGTNRRSMRTVYHAGEGEPGLRSPFTHPAIRPDASSNSAAVVPGPKLNRIAERSTSSGTPIAFSTGDGNSDPLEHAEPVEHATPARSSFINSRSARQPGNDTFAMYGDPSAGELTTTGGQVARNCIRK